MELTDLTGRAETAKKLLLEPFFVNYSEASTFKPLNVTIDAGIPTSYNSKTTTFNYNNAGGSNNAADNSDGVLMSIGEEVSHYIHHQINPKVWKDIPLDKKLQYFGAVEFVGHYGMLCLFDSMDRAMPNVPILGQTVMTDNPEEFETLLIHKISYEYAHECFKRHRATKLSILSLMDPQLLEIHLHRLAPITWIHRKILPLYDWLTQSPYRDIKSS